MGINLGDVIVEGKDSYGEGVNIAARLKALAEPGGGTVSRTVTESELPGDHYAVSANASETKPSRASRGVHRGHARDGTDDLI